MSEAEKISEKDEIVKGATLAVKGAHINASVPGSVLLVIKPAKGEAIVLDLRRAVSGRQDGRALDAWVESLKPAKAEKPAEDEKPPAE